MQIVFWCPTPALRDALAAAVDLTFAQIDFLELADQSACRIRYARTFEIDQAEKVLLFRRDLLYTVEYPTATITSVFEIGAIGATMEVTGAAAAFAVTTAADGSQDDPQPLGMP